MSDLTERVERSIQARALFKRGQTVLVGVSGGVDSMVLLHVLHNLSRKNSWRLAVAHLNHQLRGRSSDADERLVVRTARQLGLRCITGRADVRKFARAGKLSIEMAARQLRHEFFARTAARLRIQSLALAHHADDQVELFFLRLLRGSGNEGLAGMKWSSRSPVRSPNSRNELHIVRPLLDMTKTALCQFASEHGIPFRQDASNSDRDIQRNRIRHELLPLLRRKYQPALDRTILRAMEIAASDAEMAGAAASSWLNTRRGAFDRLPIAIQRRVLQLQLQERSIAGEYDLVERLRTQPAKTTVLTPTLSVQRNREGRLEWREGTVATSKTTARNSDHSAPRPSKKEIRIVGRSGETTFDGVSIRWRITSQRTFQKPANVAGQEIFDADRIGSRIVLRHWRAGDRFQPIGMFSAVKLQDLFTNQKIARMQRHELVVATTRRGELFWVEKLRIGEAFKLSNSTIRCLHWKWKRL